MPSHHVKVDLIRQIATEWGVPMSALTSSQVAPSVGEYMPKVMSAASTYQVEKYHAH
jgi:hypothetical protein